MAEGPAVLGKLLKQLPLADFINSNGKSPEFGHLKNTIVFYDIL